MSWGTGEGASWWGDASLEEFADVFEGSIGTCDDTTTAVEEETERNDAEAERTTTEERRGESTGRRGSRRLSRVQCSAEKQVWSRRHAVWKAFRVEKPRRAVEADWKERWTERHRPESLVNIIEHDGNRGAVASMKKATTTFRHLLIRGPPGSGKTTLLEAFLGDANEEVVRIKEDEILKSSDLAARVRSRLDTLRKKQPDKVVYVVIDDVGNLAGRAQQSIFAALEEHLEEHLDDDDCKKKKTRFVLAADSDREVLEKIEANVDHILIQTPMTLRMGLELLLDVAVKERAGFERTALRRIFDKCPDATPENVHLPRVFNAFQKVFSKWDFVSVANVQKELDDTRLNLFGDPLSTGEDRAAACSSSLNRPRGGVKKNPRRKVRRTVQTIPATASLGPRETWPRCEKCTLIPPCAHVSKTALDVVGLTRRDEFPRRPDAAPVCQCFLKTGACRIFNERGRCALDHPSDLHDIAPTSNFCALCTLPWPCRKCRYSHLRDDLIRHVQRSNTWIRRCFDTVKPPYARLFSKGLDALRACLASSDAFLSLSLSTDPSQYSDRLSDLQSFHLKPLVAVLGALVADLRPPDRESGDDGRRNNAVRSFQERLDAEKRLKVSQDLQPLLKSAAVLCVVPAC